MASISGLWLRAVLISAAALLLISCGEGESEQAGSGGSRGSDTISGEVRFHREVELPAGAVVRVVLWDSSLADAAAVELGAAAIADVARLPVRFEISYDREAIEDGREYTLDARVEVDGELLYVTDTVHPVLSRGHPRNSDVQVVTVSGFDQCVEPLRGEIYSAFGDGALPDDAVLELQLWDVSAPDAPILVVEASFDELGAFPIAFALPHEGVMISRHHRYELEAQIWFSGALQFEIPTAELRRTVLPYCPDGGALSIIHDVFPVSGAPAE